MLVWNRAVHGTHVVIPTWSLKDPKQYHLQVLDFSTSRCGLNSVSDMPPAEGKSIAESTLVRSVSGLVAHTQAIFAKPVESRLLYYTVTFGKGIFDVDDELLKDDAWLVCGPRRLQYPAEEDDHEVRQMGGVGEVTAVLVGIIARSIVVIQNRKSV
ncbi:hypothetical protein K488DRAFT_70630 [Vararia minispora EC-137]|uniref:Uncharacterized protein n=1 Tax=Vararia minispora EC-137 TaxID=1314806 RepID=A0ACB8QL87_9AGAM|nr:hypothetical protein K488DRAFT_70630 [Vararia minispora EC-137]